MRIDLEEISKIPDIGIKEYLHLKYLYYKKIGEHKDFVDNYGNIAFIDMVELEKKGYIKYAMKDYELRNKILNLFEGEKELFYTFLSTFPIKTPSGRPLSVKGPETLGAERLKKIWNRFFKNKAVEGKKAIRVLEAELQWRKDTNSLEFMHNAETWLRQCDFDKFSYLLDDYGKVDQKTREDFS